MKKEREFENILDECLEKIIQGKTVEQCLAEYPEHAAALEPMLRTVAKARTATNIRPRPEFKDRARHEFQAAIREMQPAPSSRTFFPKLKPVWVALAALVAIVVAGGSTVYAASNSLPDSPLYQVKLATESVRLALTPSELGKAELYAEFADERVEEIVRMAEKGKVEQVEVATERLNSQLVAMASLTIGENGTPADTKALSFEAGAPAVEEEMTRTATAAATVIEMAPAPATATETVPSADSAPKPEEDAQLGTAEVVPTEAPDASLSAGGTNRADAAVEDEATGLSREERLKEELLRQAIENPEVLEKALETATGSMRDLLLWAIEVANAGYDEAIKNLE
jgi:hypothetical protein